EPCMEQPLFAKGFVCCPEAIKVSRPLGTFQIEDKMDSSNYYKSHKGWLQIRL
ncbi:hypothetical protein HispidOSU_026180, partial [Sigmodon hispidus]